MVGLALLVLALCSLSGHAEPLPPPQQPALLPEALRSLPAPQRVSAFAQLSTLAALSASQDAKAAAEGEARQRLAALLPHLPPFPASPGELQALQQAAAQDLAADLASDSGMAGRVRSKLARTLTLVNIAWFIGCILVVTAGTSLFGLYAAALLALIPLPAYEAAGYAASLAILKRAAAARPSTAPHIALTGLLLFTASACGSIALHQLHERFRGHKDAALSTLLACFAALYGAAAVRLQAPLLGTMAVWWAMSALGFFVAVLPFVTVTGFRNGLLRPFVASLALILLFLPFKATPDTLPLPPALRPFETGVWLWCTLVLNLVNLILADKHWARGAARGGLPPSEVWQQLPLRARMRLLARWAALYALAQLPSLAVIGGTLACGTLLDVEQCRAVGAVFAFLWVCTKLAEFDWQRVGFAWAALAFGSALWAAAYAAHVWMAGAAAAGQHSSG